MKTFLLATILLSFNLYAQGVINQKVKILEGSNHLTIANCKAEKNNTTVLEISDIEKTPYYSMEVSRYTEDRNNTTIINKLKEVKFKDYNLKDGLELKIVLCEDKTQFCLHSYSPNTRLAAISMGIPYKPKQQAISALNSYQYVWQAKPILLTIGKQLSNTSLFGNSFQQSNSQKNYKACNAKPTKLAKLNFPLENRPQLRSIKNEEIIIKHKVVSYE